MGPAVAQVQVAASLQAALEVVPLVAAQGRLPGRHLAARGAVVRLAAAPDRLEAYRRRAQPLGELAMPAAPKHRAKP